MLVWKDEYSVGVELIDIQHKRLFEIGNDAYTLLKDEFCVDKYDRIILILEDLRQYAKFHFQSEENYMMSINSEQLESQKIEHAGFVEQLDNVDFRSIDENPKENIDKILSFIFNWILEHVLLKDKLINQSSK
ncbi:bacteriohemerythrin [Inconstantimicrobium mannanitabidum]|uniref:Bacteriohemerythrin n=1 Tax=Inconstantimicrobium mannanitabidum TaxID=1604901 RepID=A0ACB5R8D2_9CLOT|nr:hemerythrin domain-containing protein [Clostridium sp. TW13]GKX65291.1 bacteriohemerythrin [Clostridium sp. TW13]